ncbi:MAG: hypothetical protein ACK5LR_09810 [Mangrovibacterium sp.]
MRILFIALLGLIFQFSGWAQNIQTDISGNLSYVSVDKSYKATLRQNIFDDLTFADSNNNQVVLKAEYIKLEYGKLFENEEAKFDFFLNMVQQHRKQKGYIASYEVDIFGTIKVKDNQGWELEVGKDGVGNSFRREERNGERQSFENKSGMMTFKSNHKNASLRKDVFKQWIYKDSNGNELRISEKTFGKLLWQYGNDEEVFMYLVNTFLLLEEDNRREHQHR